MASVKNSFDMTLADFIMLARELQLQCLQIQTIKGLKKLQHGIQAEINFFLTLESKDEEAQKAHLQSSNIGHFAALCHAARHLPGVVGVLQPFTSPDRQHSLVVDVVAEEGRAWVKVIARKGQALHQIWAGRGQFGERDMVQQLLEYQACARHRPVRFRPPRVHAAFYNTVTAPMAATLRARGVRVWGRELPVCPQVQHMLRANSFCTDDDDDDNDDDNDFSDDVNNGAAGFDVINDVVCESGEQGRVVVKKDRVILLTDIETQQLTGDRLYSDDLETDCAYDVDQNKMQLSDIHLGEHSSESTSKADELLNTFGAGSLISEVQDSFSDFSLQSSGRCWDECTSWRCPQSAGPSEESSVGLTRAWCSLSSRSRQCLSKILIACPQFPGCLADPRAADDGSASAGVTGGDDVDSDDVEAINLDITTLIALVSAVCHGGCNFRFQDKVIDQQAAEERQRPTLPDLQQYLQGKKLLVCRTALTDFESIVGTLGGPRERERAAQLLNQVTVVDDQLSERAAKLQSRGKVKERSKAVFGTGDCCRAVTVTANCGFVRAAFSQGVNFAVHVHAARALTEKKESAATSLQQSSEILNARFA